MRTNRPKKLFRSVFEEKRGDVAVSLNWVFVSVVGIIILAFFVGFIIKQGEFSEKKVTTKVLNDMELITVGAGASKGTIQEINLPKTELRFTCEDCDCNFYIGKLQKPYGDKIIFGPDYLRGRIGLAWTLDWGAPYRAANFLFFTSTEARYILYYPSGNTEMKNLAYKINKTIPSGINSELLQWDLTNPPKDYNNYKVRIVYFGLNPLTMDELNNDLSDISDMEDKDVSSLYVTADSDLNIGTLRYFSKSGNMWEQSIQTTTNPTYYLGEESLLAAIFSENPFIYRCNMKKAFKRLSTTSEIYRQRTSSLVDYYQFERAGGEEAVCAFKLDEAKSGIIAVRDNAEQLSKIFATPGTDSKTPIDTIAEAKDRIEAKNQEAQYFSCSVIY